MNIADEIKVCEAATEGPWMWQPPHGDNVGGIRTTAGVPIITCGIDTREYPSVGLDPSEEDAVFIVHARTGYPKALKALEKIKAVLHSEVSGGIAFMTIRAALCELEGD